MREYSEEVRRESPKVEDAEDKDMMRLLQWQVYTNAKAEFVSFIDHSLNLACLNAAGHSVNPLTLLSLLREYHIFHYLLTGGMS